MCATVLTILLFHSLIYANWVANFPICFLWTSYVRLITEKRNRNKMKKKNLRRSTRQRGTDTTEESKKNCKPTDWMKQKKKYTWTICQLLGCYWQTSSVFFSLHENCILYIWWCCRQRRYFHPIELVFVCQCVCACERQMKRFWSKEKSERKKMVIVLRLMQSPKFAGVAKSRCQAK